MDLTNKEKELLINERVSKDINKIIEAVRYIVLEGFYRDRHMVLDAVYDILLNIGNSKHILNTYRAVLKNEIEIIEEENSEIEDKKNEEYIENLYDDMKKDKQLLESKKEVTNEQQTLL